MSPTYHVTDAINTMCAFFRQTSHSKEDEVSFHISELPHFSIIQPYLEQYKQVIVCSLYQAWHLFVVSHM